MNQVKEIISLPQNFDFKRIPIFIVSYNRKIDLEKLINRLLTDGYANIIVLDNHSDDIALLEYLNKINKDKVKVIFLKKNYGHKVLWESHLFDDIIESSYYVLTDPDVVPIEQCPSDYVELFYNILQMYPKKTKVGFALKLNDIPDSYPFKYPIIRFESFYWEKVLPFKSTIYDANIDTTFALYKPGKYSEKYFYDAIRTGFPYVARHLGWYRSPSKLESHYINKDNVFTTSYNAAAIKNFEVATIRKIISTSLSDYKFRKIARNIFSLMLLKKFNVFDIGIGIILILLKKIKSIFI
jgi:hypothetical protein